jgi:hypothetical protein
MKRHVKVSRATRDEVWAKRLRRDAQRRMSANLSEGIALSRMLARFVGVARPK